jgi:hypothetical protein
MSGWDFWIYIAFPLLCYGWGFFLGRCSPR